MSQRHADESQRPPWSWHRCSASGSQPVGGGAANSAVQLRAWSIVTVPVPHPAPDHPWNSYPSAASALSVTDVSASYVAVHVSPHDTPAGSLVTRLSNAPSPLLPTLSVSVRVKVAVQARAPSRVTVAVDDEPLQSPLQPAKRDPASGVAVSVT